MRSWRTSALLSRETRKVMYVREIAVCSPVMTIEVGQSGGGGGQGREGGRGTRRVLLFLHLTHPLPATPPQRRTRSPGPPPDPAGRPSAPLRTKKALSAFKEPPPRPPTTPYKTATSCLSLTCIKWPSPPTFECYIAKRRFIFYLSQFNIVFEYLPCLKAWLAVTLCSLISPRN